MEVRIRAAERKDAGAVLDALEWLFAPPGARPDDWDPERARKALDEAISSPDALVLLAELEDGLLVGYCTVYHGPHTIRFGMRAWLEELAVHPDRRSAGIGARLLDAARAWARQRGASHLKLDSALPRTEAHRFYERQRPSGRSYSFAWRL